MRIVVDDRNACPGLSGTTRRRDSGGASADDQDIDIFRDGPLARAVCRSSRRDMAAGQGNNLPTIAARKLARSLMRHAVDCQSALETDAHAAQRTA
jgi:hypothetical protein